MSESLKLRLLEDVFKLMDEHTAKYKEAQSKGYLRSRSSPDLLVSDVYKILTKGPRDFYRPPTDAEVSCYKFRGEYFCPANKVFENTLIELGFELYVDKGRAYRIRTVVEEKVS